MPALPGKGPRQMQVFGLNKHNVSWPGALGNSTLPAAGNRIAGNPMRSPGAVPPAPAESGSAIVICLLVLVLLSLLGVYATQTTTLEVRIAAHRKQATEAFYAAESAISEGRARLSELTAGAFPATTTWRGYLGFPQVAQLPQIAAELSGYQEADLVASAQIEVPFLVEIRHLNEEDRGIDLCGGGLQAEDVRFWGDLDGDGRFEENPVACGGPTAGTPIAVLTGWGIAGAVSGSAPSVKKITVEARREPLKPVLFGDLLLDIQTTAAITAGTGAPDSAHIAGNTQIRLATGIEVEGEILLGRQNDGTAAVFTVTDGSAVNAHGGIHQRDRLDPDPLGLAGGILAEALETSRTINDNLMGASPAITDQTIQLSAASPQGTAMTLAPGTYHLTAIALAENSTLTIDNSTGTVTVFLEGPLQTAVGSKLRVLGAASRFIIYGATEDPLNLAHTGDFKGCIHAPKSTVTLANSGQVTGMIWGARTILANSGEFAYDPGARGRFIHSRARLVSWRGP